MAGSDELFVAYGNAFESGSSSSIAMVTGFKAYENGINGDHEKLQDETHTMGRAVLQVTNEWVGVAPVEGYSDDLRR